MKHERNHQWSRRVRQRAEALLTEERRAGSSDPLAQAEELLTESDLRTLSRTDPTGPGIERRHSEETVDPVPAVTSSPRRWWGVRRRSGPPRSGPGEVSRRAR